MPKRIQRTKTVKSNEVKPKYTPEEVICSLRHFIDSTRISIDNAQSTRPEIKKCHLDPDQQKAYLEEIIDRLNGFRNNKINELIEDAWAYYKCFEDVCK